MNVGLEDLDESMNEGSRDLRGQDKDGWLVAGNKGLAVTTTIIPHGI